MKIGVECKSQLLQKSLELFLSSYLSSLKNCDIVVRDYRVLDDAKNFFISKDSDADLVKPFSKSSLILALERRYAKLSASSSTDEKSLTQPANFEILQKRIEMLTQEYQQNILKAVRAFYEE